MRWLKPILSILFWPSYLKNKLKLSDLKAEVIILDKYFTPLEVILLLAGYFIFYISQSLLNFTNYVDGCSTIDNLLNRILSAKSTTFVANQLTFILIVLCKILYIFVFQVFLYQQVPPDKRKYYTLLIGFVHRY